MTRSPLAERPRLIEAWTDVEIGEARDRFGTGGDSASERRSKMARLPSWRRSRVTARYCKAGKERRRVEGTLATPPTRLGPAGSVIAKPVDPTRGQVNEVSAAGPGPILSWKPADQRARTIATG